jgi:rRNA maturation RNase YbeY
MRSVEGLGLDETEEARRHGALCMAAVACRVSKRPAIRYDAAMPVEIVRRGGGKRFPSRRLKHIALEVLQLVREKRAELSIALIGDAEMQKLNARYRQKNYPTDVLSFPVEENVPGDVRLLGDVVISVDKARRQAKERARTLDEEMVTLLIHGVLHLLGYDHERSAKEARRMGRLEKKVYRALCAKVRLRL